MFYKSSYWGWFNDKAAVGETFRIDQPFFKHLLREAKEDGAKAAKYNTNDYIYPVGRFLVIIEVGIGGGLIKFKERKF